MHAIDQPRRFGAAAPQWPWLAQVGTPDSGNETLKKRIFLPILQILFDITRENR
jgi:hypothetical protein